uniref:Pre-mRNA-processing factor 17 n=1 Tax=Panagrellus redivivus TaxID=6233 RepID=A0A7E4VPC2_PANRE
MNSLKAYADDSDADIAEEVSMAEVADPEAVAKRLGLDFAPIADVVPYASSSELNKGNVVAIIDTKTKKLNSNPRYEQLFKPEAGPVNPFKSDKQRAQKNMLTGFVEKAHINEFHFNNEAQSFNTLGFAKNPSAEAGNSIVGDLKKAAAMGGTSVADPKVKTGLQKRKRVVNYDSADVEGFTGPWSRFEDEKDTAKAEPGLQAEMDEYTKKRRAMSRAGRKRAREAQHVVDETVTCHVKDNPDYKQRSFMSIPMYTGANLRDDYVPHRCFPPTKQMHTFKGHTKPINALRWLPGSAHLFLSCGMDAKVKLWEVYGNRKCIQTYFGHKMPVKDVAFNYDGREFLTASFDNYIKVWDTETGQVKQRLTTGHRAFCLKYNPDEDKQNIFLSGMQNKKIIQWDTRTGEIEQEYDRHLGPVNSVTFFDDNRRFCSTSDDKSIRIWEWGIPVDTKLIQNAGLHSIPTMTKSPNEKWIVGQAMDNRLVLFQLIDDKLKFSKKHAFKGHNVAGYACTSDFSPEMSFLCSGDAQGRVYIWDWNTHKIVTRWKAHENVCIATLWHPHEKSRMITAGWEGDIKMWNT